MDQNTLLTSMLIAYIAPIGVVYYKYSTAVSGAGTRSISSIITSQEPLFAHENDTAGAGGAQCTPLFQTRHFIAASMFVMAVFTILYEYQRCIALQIWWSLFTIIVLLIGIFGVIYIPEHDRIHYIFAGAVFFAIVGFMTGHTAADIHNNLRILLYAQFLFILVTIIGVIHDTPIFIFEALFLVNFAVFYLYMHYMHYMH